MQERALAAAARLSDRDLLRRVEELAGRERHATVELIAHLGELDKRRLYREQGYGSLFSYCTEALRLSEHAAFNRIEAARASRVFPVILELLAEGSVNLSTLRLLAPHLTRENHELFLADAKGRSKREVEELVARLAPRADVPASVRKLPTPACASLEASGESERVPWVSVAHRPVVSPLAPERYRIQFTIGRKTQENLRRVQELLRREIPDGDMGVIFERALTLLLADVARKKLAETPRPRPSRGTEPHSRYVPSQVKRTVWLRDGGQCAFVARNGRRCRERAFLEFHHVQPYGSGGETTEANLSLRCRAHNTYEAEMLFGPYVPIVGETVAAYGAGNGSGVGRALNPLGSTRPGAS